MAKHPLRVNLEDIPRDGLTRRWDQSDPAFAELLAAVGEVGERSGFVEVHIEDWGERVDVRGRLSASVPATCSRGLASYQQPLVAEFEHIFVRGLVLGEEDEGVELQSDDLDREPLVGDHIDLGAAFAEQLQLAFPYKPLCVQECAGPCPDLGEPAAPEEDADVPVDPRWAALASLKVKS